MKKYSIFATSKAKTIFLTYLRVVFFISTSIAVDAANTGYHSNGYYTERSVIVFAETEKGSLSSLKYYNFSFMAKTMKDANGLNNSMSVAREACESGKSMATIQLHVSNPYGIVCFADLSAEMQKHFDVEKNEKNMLYAFILALNLSDEFQKFKKEFSGVNPHELCLTILSEMS